MDARLSRLSFTRDWARWLAALALWSVVWLSTPAILAAMPPGNHSGVAPLHVPAQPFDKESSESDGGFSTSAAFAGLRGSASPDAGGDSDAESTLTLGSAIPSDADRITSLEKQVLDLSKKLEKTSAKPAKDAAEKKPTKGGWVDLSDEKWTVKLGGHVQMDYILWPSASPAIVGDQNYFSFRRLRLVADGTGYGVYDFRLQLTLEPGTEFADPFYTAAVKDAYFSMNEIPWIGRWRIGNFFVPFGLEQVTNDTNNIFLERSIPTQNIFTGDREVGMAIYNCTEDKNITWAAGVFFDNVNDNVKVRLDNNQGCRISGRLTWLPYYDEPSNGRYLIHTGVGILHTLDHDHLVRFRSRPQIKEGPFLIDSGTRAANTYTTANVEAAVVWGQVTVQSEAYLSSVNLNAGGPRTIGGAYVHLSYFLTGENRKYERFGQHGAQFARNVPYTNVFAAPGCIGWGGWEFKTRYSNLTLDSLNAGAYNDLTVGFNWYWSDRTRVMFDWIHPVTTPGTVFGAVQADILGLRFDFNW